MSTPSRPIVVRLTSEQAAKFDRLCVEFKGLQKSAVLRMLIGSTLLKPLDDQVKIINGMIRGKSEPLYARHEGLNRVSKD